MDRIFEIILVMVILILSCWSMWLSHEAMATTERISEQVSYTFIRS